MTIPLLTNRPLSASELTLKCISLKAFSLEQEPHIMVVTCSRPGGAAATRTDLSWVTQSWPG